MQIVAQSGARVSYIRPKGVDFMKTDHSQAIVIVSIDEEAPSLLDARISSDATITEDGKIQTAVRIATADSKLMYNRLRALIREYGAENVVIPTGVTAELIEGYREKSTLLRETEAELELARNEIAKLYAENMDCHDDYAKLIIASAKATITLGELNKIADEVTSMMANSRSSVDRDGAEAFLQLGRMCALIKKLCGIFTEEDAASETTAE